MFEKEHTVAIKNVEGIDDHVGDVEQKCSMVIRVVSVTNDRGRDRSKSWHDPLRTT